MKYYLVIKRNEIMGGMGFRTSQNKPFNAPLSK